MVGIEKSDQIRSEKEIYREYLSLWENELEDSVKKEKNLFRSESQYNNWKNYLEQYLISVQNIFDIENELFVPSETSALGMLISRSQLIREITIEVKNFLYRLECDNKAIEVTECGKIPISWSYQATQLYLNMTQEDQVGSSENASEIIELQKYFNDNVNKNPEIFFLQYFLKISTENSKVLDEIEKNYKNLLHFWELESSFTVENAEQLFENSNKYNQWKNRIDQLETARQTLSRCEFSILTTPPLSRIPPHIKLYRQQVIEIKFFVYLLEYQQKSTDSIKPSDIAIEWSVKG